MFAIAIASVGLNGNSTAVIIGWMLISPLMGPIIGAGYGVGVQDSQLVRLALRNLAVLTGISLTVSTLYFALTPLEDAQSELLARTSPTLWDVLIAFFGGAAGMVGLARKEKSTLIPGVAIATALMPPLCTAGYGLATAQPHFAIGAFYLFTINGVFIAVATLLFTRYLRLPVHAFADAAEQRRVAELERSLADRDARDAAQRSRHAQLAEEIRAQFPLAQRVRVTVDDNGAKGRLVVLVEARSVPAPRELARLRAWLAVRLGGAEDADFELVVGRPAG